MTPVPEDARPLHGVGFAPTLPSAAVVTLAAGAVPNARTQDGSAAFGGPHPGAGFSAAGSLLVLLATLAVLGIGATALAVLGTARTLRRRRLGPRSESDDGTGEAT